jgi:hypothetical protein
MNKSDVTIKLRMDVDYAYPSRIKSFVYTALGKRSGKNYLKNSKIIAQMINESDKNVRAYWFFTPTTIPDAELLAILDEKKHEVALHVATDAYKELKTLEQATDRKTTYYTVHGTQRLVMRLLWKRKLSQAKAPIPADFPLKSFYDFPTIGLDVLCYDNPYDKVMEIVAEGIARRDVLHVHPEWLFQRGTVNHRGPYYEVLKTVLGVDEDLKTLVIRKKSFFKMAQDVMEYRQDIRPTDAFLRKLADRGVDVYTFIERKWSSNIPVPQKSWVKAEDNVGLLAVKTYDEWLTLIGKKTRNMVRKAEKSGVKTEVIERSDKLAEGIWKIYNETPIRQDRAFPHYGAPLEHVKALVTCEQESIYLGAFLNEELVGFIRLAFGYSTAVIQQILSLQKHADKAINNALIAKAVQVCAERRIAWLMYGRIGNHPSLDKFKENNGFTKVVFPRYYVPLTGKGRLAIKLGLQREFKDSLPNALKYPLFPIFNWVSRNRQRLRLWLNKRQHCEMPKPSPTGRQASPIYVA